MNSYKFATYSVSNKEDTALVRVSGTIEPSAAEELEKVLDRVVEIAPGVLYIDMTNVEYMSSFSFGYLVKTGQDLLDKKKNVILLNPPESIENIMRILGLTGFFEIQKDFDLSSLTLQNINP